MLKHLIFKLKVKKLDEIHIRQYIERKGYELIYIHSQRGKEVLSLLELENVDEEGFVYNHNDLKYVFLGNAKDDADKLMILLHECGHIEHKHKSISKLNEAQAWHFAYTVLKLPQKIIKNLIYALITVAITCTLIGHNMPAIVPAASYDYKDAETLSDSSPATNNIKISDNESDIVYVTKTGTRFHLADCYTIKGKTITEYSRAEAEKHHTPCKICRP